MVEEFPLLVTAMQQNACWKMKNMCAARNKGTALQTYELEGP